MGGGWILPGLCEDLRGAAESRLMGRRVSRSGLSLITAGELIDKRVDREQRRIFPNY